jgi:hypothetical protein
MPFETQAEAEAEADEEDSIVYCKDCGKTLLLYSLDNEEPGDECWHYCGPANEPCKWQCLECHDSNLTSTYPRRRVRP